MAMTNAAPITTDELNSRVRSLEVNIQKLQATSTDENLANELTCIKIGIYILIATVFIIAFVAAAVLLKVLRVKEQPIQKYSLTQKACEPKTNIYSTGKNLKEKDINIGMDLPSNGGYEAPLNREQNNYEELPPVRSSLMNPCYGGVASAGVYEEVEKPNYERFNSTEEYQEISNPDGEGSKNFLFFINFLNNFFLI